MSSKRPPKARAFKRLDDVENSDTKASRHKQASGVVETADALEAADEQAIHAYRSEDVIKEGVDDCQGNNMAVFVPCGRARTSPHREMALLQLRAARVQPGLQALLVWSWC